MKHEIKNKTKNVVISKDYVKCISSFSKTVGLMFSKSPKILVFFLNKEKISPLHMLFVFFPIDVLFLNKDTIVVETKESFSPFTFYKPSKKALYIIELPIGTIKKTKTAVGDKIEF